MRDVKEGGEAEIQKVRDERCETGRVKEQRSRVGDVKEGEKK